MTQCKALKVIEGFYSATESDILYQRLLQEQNWPANHYLVAGRQFTLPRLQTWHADPGIRYSYSNNLLQTQDWTPLLTEIKRKVELTVNFGFNAVLVNLYRNGRDYVGWHADDELELGPEPLIASLTLGAERVFEFRRKKTATHGQLTLTNGSLLLMQADFQHHWLHRLPVDHTQSAGRINLTFRKVFIEALE